ncbi:protein transport protein Sec16B isoform 2-T5 [Odontesthes bonariensis]|uniref:protein transport protein Sec16B isoform X2 n=1 Tax=Odontesthes bonariensis TaxID=219752 RepID=UPI003F58D3E6
MDLRGLPDSDRQSHKTKDKEHYSPQREGLSSRHWGHSDPRYPAHFTGPPTTHEQFPYSTQQYAYGYGWPEHQRHKSSFGYDYPPHSHWDYRDSYGYYNYYRGQHEQQDGGQWRPQESWRGNQCHERTHKQDHTGSLSAEEYRYDHRRESSLHHLNDHKHYPSRENEEISSYYLGMLESSKDSGLSSSSYELSQYINGAEHSDSDPQAAPTSDGDNGPVHKISVPLKYSIPHVVVSFGPSGQLIRVTPGLSTQENISQLEIHSMEVILSETKEQQEMRNFPGPLTREDLHKIDAIEFAQQKAGTCMRDENLPDKSSAALLWNVLILLCRQNGQIVGSDIAELLMHDSYSDGNWESVAPTLIDFNEDITAAAPSSKGDDLLTGDPSSFNSECSQKALESYTELLLAGRKKEALESAMTSGLWGHALFLASKMGSRSYTTVLNRFTGQLTASDPLQTLFQLLSGRIPTVAMCCGNEKWGDWRPHLAVMLSNETGNPSVQQKAIITMGDSLASRGLIDAAHLCYLTASVPFGMFTQKAERLVLLGSSHRQSFEHFATNSAIQCTELHEYCQTLGGKSFSIPSFQVYKFLYASRLLDCGLSSQAFHYCEVVGEAILRQREPCSVLTGEVIKLSDRLRYSYGEFSEGGFSGAGEEPEWLKCLRARCYSLQTGSYDCNETYQPAVPSSALAYEDSKVCADSDFDDLGCDIQSPENELLYYRESEDQESLLYQTGQNTEEMTAMSCGDRGAQDWPHANSSSVPVTVAYAVPTVAVSQNFSYHNTDSAEVKSALPHCPLRNVKSAAEEAELSPGAAMSAQTGWFSGWFKSKPKDIQKENSEQGGPAQTELSPTAGLYPTPPPAAVPPGLFPSQPGTAGINPSSRKAWQQLG